MFCCAITFAETTPSGHERFAPVERHVRLRKADGQHVRPVDSERRDKFEQSQVVLLGLEAEARVNERLHAALDPLLVGAGKVDAAHPHDEALRRDPGEEIMSNARLSGARLSGTETVETCVTR